MVELEINTIDLHSTTILIRMVYSFIQKKKLRSSELRVLRFSRMTAQFCYSVGMAALSQHHGKKQIHIATLILNTIRINQLILDIVILIHITQNTNVVLNLITRIATIYSKMVKPLFSSLNILNQEKRACKQLAAGQPWQKRDTQLAA